MTTRDTVLMEGEGPVEAINPKDPPPEPMPGLYSTKMAVTSAASVEVEWGTGSADDEESRVK